ncbi:outer membrane protein assembly factor BamA [Desulfobacterales bacterium HSG17]|nr:outer membrane protein assembly factor BamA [Desulfobacterales bacterium HSG17]
MVMLALFNLLELRNDIIFLTDFYSDGGFAYAEVTPVMDKDDENLTVDLVYKIAKNQKVKFERIVIRGNTRTRDKVIRRQLPIFEQGLYSGTLLKKGIQSINMMDYFEDVKMDTQEGSTEDQMIVTIDVKEKPTGSLSFGGGYASEGGFFGVVEVTQRNLFGRGQILMLQTEFGGLMDQYRVRFIEPWVMDIPLSMTAEAFTWEKDYDTYDWASTGGELAFSYPVWKRWLGTISFFGDVGNYSNVTTRAPFSVFLNSLFGDILTLGSSVSLQYDTRNDNFRPTRGVKHFFRAKYTGFGGDVGFTKYIAETSWYKTLWKDLVGLAHAKAGYVHENSGGYLPDYEKFFLGGPTSMRGFERSDLAPRDIFGRSSGGDKFVQLNFELTYPLFEEMGIIGVAFMDIGNVYGNVQDFDLGEMRESAGVGVRWNSPFGPLRIEYAFILDPTEQDSSTGKLELGMGAAF